MKRHALQSVTDALPILVPGDLLGKRGAECDGWLEVGSLNVLVAEVRDSSSLRMPAESKRLDKALGGLRAAMGLSKPGELARAIEKACASFKQPAGMLVTVDPGLRERAMKSLYNIARATYAALMNQATQDARAVMWTAGNGKGRTRPGLYCPDIATAYFARMMLAPAEVRLCASPECRRPFHPKRKDHVHHAPGCRVGAKRYYAKLELAKQSRKAEKL